MRQSRLIAILAVILALLGLAAWVLFRPGAAARVNSINTVASLDTEQVGDPLRHSNSARDGAANQPLTGDPYVPGRPDEPDAAPALPIPGENEWLLKGRVELSPEILTMLRRNTEWQPYLDLQFLADGQDRSEVCWFTPELAEDRSFNEIADCHDFGIEEGEALPKGRWQALFAHNSDYGLTLEDEPAEGLRGLLTPRINGREIDFGVIHIGSEDYFAQYVVLTGRLVHTTGRALAYSGTHWIYGEYETTQGEDTWTNSTQCDFWTGGDGAFSAVCWLEEVNPADAYKLYKWSIAADENYGWEGSEPRQDLKAPTWTGRAGSFGDITLSGALVEMVLKSDMKPVLNEQGGLALSEWRDYEGDCVEIEFEGGDSYYNLTVYPEPFITVTVLREGRYVWDSWPSADGYYNSPRGVLLARDGQVHRIELVLSQYASIPIVIKARDGQELTGCSYNWTIMKGEVEIDGAQNGYSELSRVPVAAGAVTEVSAWASGYGVSSATVQPGAEKVEIMLDRDDTPHAKVVVVIPKFPAVKVPAGGAPNFSAQLVLSGPWGNISYSSSQFGKDVIEHTLTVWYFGKGTATLHGGESFGYPGGVLSGPIEFEVAAGQTVRVVLPEIAAPPWPSLVRTVKVTALAGGSPVNLKVPVKYQGLPQPVAEDCNDGSDLKLNGTPLALTDGREDYPVEFTLPSGESNEAHLRIDLPHTLEVRALRGGKPAQFFRVSAYTANAKAPDLHVQCETYATNGVAKLWVPRGPVQVSVDMGGSTIYSQAVDITPGAVTQIEASCELLELTLRVHPVNDANAGTGIDGPSLWRLQQDSEGTWIEYSSFDWTLIVMAPAGKYRVVAWNGQPAPIEFELAEDRTIELPEVKVVQRGALVLKFDVSQLGDDDADCSFTWQLVSDLQLDRAWQYGHWSAATLVPDGFKLSGLPINADLVIWGNVWVDDDEDGYSLLLRPMKVRITGEKTIVAASFGQLIELHEEWYSLDARCKTGVPGLSVQLEESATAGRAEIEFYREGELAHTAVVNFPEKSEEPFRIPESLRAELIAKELLAAEEEE